MCFEKNNIPCLQDKHCVVCFERSFASVDKAQFWSIKNELKPWQIKKSSAKKFLFICEFKHEFETVLYSITNQNSWCPYPCCSNKKLCYNINCHICFDASFASSEKSKFWSDKNNLKAYQVKKKSEKKIWFNCYNSNHEFETRIDHIYNGSWCPYPCCNTRSQKLCSDENCHICFDASFASSDKAKFWSNKNKFIPREVFKNSSKKYWFTCENCHDFEIILNSITGNGNWCSRCIIWKNQEECIKYIEEVTQLKFEHVRPKFLQCLELDGYNSELQLAIEYNGKQHYEFNSFFHQGNKENLKKQQKRDQLKQKLCHQNGIYLIVIPYWTTDNKKFIHEQLENYQFLRNYVINEIIQ